MPFQIKKLNDKYKLYNIEKRIINSKNKKDFLTKQSAVSAGINYGKYRNEKLVLKKNKLVKKK